MARPLRLEVAGGLYHVTSRGEFNGVLTTENITEIPRAQRRPLAKPMEHYVQTHSSEPRIGMAATYASGDHTMQAIAQAFGVHYTTVSRAVRTAEASARKVR